METPPAERQRAYRERKAHRDKEAAHLSQLATRYFNAIRLLAMQGNDLALSVVADTPDKTLDKLEVLANKIPQKSRSVKRSPQKN